MKFRRGVAMHGKRELYHQRARADVVRTSPNDGGAAHRAGAARRYATG
jgi:hypothetical protein